MEIKNCRSIHESMAYKEAFNPIEAIQIHLHPVPCKFSNGLNLLVRP